MKKGKPLDLLETCVGMGYTGRQKEPYASTCGSWDVFLSSITIAFLWF